MKQHLPATLIIDFDSTFIDIESLEKLAEISLDQRLDKSEVIRQIAHITNLGMAGELSFPESLSQRLALFRPHHKHIDRLAQLLFHHVTTSIEQHKSFFQTCADDIYIITGGFVDYALPLLASYGISKTHVIGNAFRYEHGTVIDYDKTRPLAQEQGKVKAVQALDLAGDVYVIGDGYTDYQIKQAGAAQTFFAFTENTRRPGIVERADVVAHTFDDVVAALGENSA